MEPTDYLFIVALIAFNAVVIVYSLGMHRAHLRRLSESLGRLHAEQHDREHFIMWHEMEIREISPCLYGFFSFFAILSYTSAGNTGNELQSLIIIMAIAVIIISSLALILLEVPNARRFFLVTPEWIEEIVLGKAERRKKLWWRTSIDKVDEDVIYAEGATSGHWLLLRNPGARMDIHEYLVNFDYLCKFLLEKLPKSIFTDNALRYVSYNAEYRADVSPVRDISMRQRIFRRRRNRARRA